MVALLAHTTVDLGECTGEPAIRLLAAVARAMAAEWQIPASAGFACAGAPLMALSMTEYVEKVSRTPDLLRPRDSLSIEPSLPTGRLVQALGTEGPCTTFGAWPGGGWHALAWAAAQLETGRAGRFVVGAWEEGPARMVWLYLGAGEEGLATLAGWHWLPGAPGPPGPGLSALVAALDGNGPIAVEAGGLRLTITPTFRQRGDRR